VFPLDSKTRLAKASERPGHWPSLSISDSQYQKPAKSGLAVLFSVLLEDEVAASVFCFSDVECIAILRDLLEDADKSQLLFTGTALEYVTPEFLSLPDQALLPLRNGLKNKPVREV
jgi:hypothetical protein